MAVTLTMGASGLTALAYDGTDLLAQSNYPPTFVDLILTDAAGKTSRGVLKPKTVTDPVANNVIETFPWGMAVVTYTAVADTLHIDVSISNTSDETITHIWLYLLALQCPAPPVDKNFKRVGFNLDAPSSVFVDYGSGALAVVNEDVVKPLAVGLWPATNPAKAKWFVMLSTDPAHTVSKNWPPTPRPIAPGITDRYSISLRFGDAGNTEARLSGDIFKLYAKAYPPLTFSNKPIAALNMTSRHRPILPKNPRGWFTASTQVDVTTPAGVQAFEAMLLSYADGAIAEMTRVGAQGGIFWDLEGQEWDAAYIGDPMQAELCAPELRGVLDQFVAKFVDAGFRIGFCLRPQTFDLGTTTQTDGPDPGGVLFAKMEYCIKRWGATLFYVDSDVVNGAITAAAAFEKLATAFPGVLIFPEWEATRHYAYTVPYNNSVAAIFGPPPEALAVYPGAICLIKVNDPTAAKYPGELAAAVKAGNILLWDGWYPHPAGELVRQLYAE